MTPPPNRRGGPAKKPSGGRGRGGAPGGRGDGPARRPSGVGTTKASQPTQLPPRRPAETVDVHDPDGVRLQKLLAAAGVGSRRVCEQYIV